jgi:hypothetical protein
MANITIFSLDYDGCSDILFEEILTAWIKKTNLSLTDEDTLDESDLLPLREKFECSL